MKEATCNPTLPGHGPSTLPGNPTLPGLGPSTLPGTTSSYPALCALQSPSQVELSNISWEQVARGHPRSSPGPPLLHGHLKSWDVARSLPIIHWCWCCLLIQGSALTAGECSSLTQSVCARQLELAHCPPSPWDSSKKGCTWVSQTCLSSLPVLGLPPPCRQHQHLEEGGHIHLEEISGPFYSW